MLRFVGCKIICGQRNGETNKGKKQSTFKTDVTDCQYLFPH